MAPLAISQWDGAYSACSSTWSYFDISFRLKTSRKWTSWARWTPNRKLVHFLIEYFMKIKHPEPVERTIANWFISWWNAWIGAIILRGGPDVASKLPQGGPLSHRLEPSPDYIFKVAPKLLIEPSPRTIAWLSMKSPTYCLCTHAKIEIFKSQ